MQWVLNVTDAGPSALRFVALAHHDDTPGCDATVRNPRSRIELGGVTAYTPHSSGQTTFTFDPRMYTCGRVQVDVSIFDAVGNEILVVGVVINYGTTCAPPPVSLVCTPPSQQPAIGQPVSFSATGGNGAFSWSAPNGSPAAGGGAAFTTVYGAAGTYVVVVTSAGLSASCRVTVPPSITPELVCTPGTQTVATGQLATFSAAGGTGVYNWSAPGGSTTSGSGATFSTSYASPGTNTVAVTSGSATKTCQVVVPPPPPPTLVCAPPIQSTTVGQTVNVGATGGDGTYSWAAPAGTPATGGGPGFSTAYAAAGAYAITVSSGTQTATCSVTVTAPPLACSPVIQTALVGAPATLTATGGSGPYTWSAPGSLNEAGSGATFEAVYPVPATNLVTVTSGNSSAVCTVTSVCPTPNQLAGDGWSTPSILSVCPTP
jgi:hypothetical protein